MGLFLPNSSIKKLGILVVSFVASSIWHGVKGGCEVVVQDIETTLDVHLN